MATEIESAWSPAKRFTLVSNGISGVEQAKMLPDNYYPYGKFAFSVSVSNDGNVCVIGALNNNDSLYSHGAAYVYRRQNGFWTMEAKLTSDDNPTGRDFGYAVAISGDGATIAVFSLELNGPGTYTPHIHVFVKSGSNWVLQKKLSMPTVVYRYGDFRNFITLASDGNTLAFGGKLYESSAAAGAVYIYVRTGTVWVEQAKLTVSDGGSLFGRSVSLSNSGNDIAIGASEHAYVFTRSGSTWSQQARLTPSDGASSYGWGSSVSISGDGNTVVSGYLVTGTVGSGAAFVFTRSGVTWSQRSKLTLAGGHDGDYFGNSVSISDNGSVCAVGAYHDGERVEHGGSVTIFKKNGGVWEKAFKLIPSDVLGGDAFGYSLSLSRDGKTCVVGSLNGTDQFGYNYGSAYVFV